MILTPYKSLVKIQKRQRDDPNGEKKKIKKKEVAWVKNKERSQLLEQRENKKRRLYLQKSEKMGKVGQKGAKPEIDVKAYKTIKAMTGGEPKKE